MELSRALERLGEALLAQDAGAIDAASREANEALRALAPGALTRAELEALERQNRKNGALLATRQAALHWALSRLAPPARTYGSDGQQSVAPPPRPLATA